jgi:ketosteroid isomerase-like protein
MSQKNVGAFNRALEAATRRDFGAMLRELHPDVEWYPAVAAGLAGEATVYRGLEGVREGLTRDFFATFDDTHFEFPEVRDLGDYVLAIGFLHARGTASGIEIESPWAFLVRYEQGQAISVRAYLDVGKALEAAELSE